MVHGPQLLGGVLLAVVIIGFPPTTKECGQSTISSLSLLMMGLVGYGFVAHTWGMKRPLHSLAEFSPFIDGLGATQSFS